MKWFALIRAQALTWINPTHITHQNEFRSFFGGENDVHQDKRERLRHIITTLYVCVVAALDLAPFEGASP
jgi:hypothetical protein